MGKDLRISLLLAYYGPLITEKQLSLLDLYYNEDLSLAEISQNEGITRQGVRDSIKKAEAALFSLEEKLHLASRFANIESALQKIRSMTDNKEIISIIDSILIQEELE